MANRHKFMTKQMAPKGGVHRADNVYGNPNVVKEAKKRKEGGSVVGKACGGRLDRKRGGKVTRAPGGGIDPNAAAAARTAAYQKYQDYVGQQENQSGQGPSPGPRQEPDGGMRAQKRGGCIKRADGGPVNRFGKSPFSSAGGGKADKSPFFK